MHSELVVAHMLDGGSFVHLSPEEGLEHVTGVFLRLTVVLAIYVDAMTVDVM